MKIIENHEELAQKVIVPYDLQFDVVADLALHSGTRYQYCEDVLWQMLQAFDVDTATDIWLDYLGKKVGISRQYFEAIAGGFTFGGTTDEGFLSGEFLSKRGIGNSSNALRSNAQYRDAIKAKIIQNATICSMSELKNACKLLFNSKLTLVTESYPANIDSIDLYGSNLIETADAYDLCKKMIACGVSLGEVNFHNAVNLFKNDAFIVYNEIIPQSDDFTLELIIKPDQVGATETIIFSQGEGYSAQFNIASLSYSNLGVRFLASPQTWTDGSEAYTDGSETYYAGEGAFELIGGTINVDEANIIKITRTLSGSDYTYKLYVNGAEEDSTITEYSMDNISTTKLYLGSGNETYYNSGSIYDFYIYNNTTSSFILNDSLSGSTTGTNNGVIFL